MWQVGELSLGQVNGLGKGVGERNHGRQVRRIVRLASVSDKHWPWARGQPSSLLPLLSYTDVVDGGP